MSCLSSVFLFFFQFSPIMSAVERPRLRGVSVCLMVTVLCVKKKLVPSLTPSSEASSLHTDENGSP